MEDVYTSAVHLFCGPFDGIEHVEVKLRYEGLFQKSRDYRVYGVEGFT
jgi:hypothetical protein